jgi:hypothetical protein
MSGGATIATASSFTTGTTTAVVTVAVVAAGVDDGLLDAFDFLLEHCVRFTPVFLKQSLPLVVMVSGMQF